MMLGFGGLTSTESKWSLLIMFPSITNIASVNIPATTCLKSTPISPFEQKTLSFPVSDPTYYKTHTHSLSLCYKKERENQESERRGMDPSGQCCQKIKQSTWQLGWEGEGLCSEVKLENFKGGQKTFVQRRCTTPYIYHMLLRIHYALCFVSLPSYSTDTFLEMMTPCLILTTPHFPFSFFSLFFFIFFKKIFYFLLFWQLGNKFKKLKCPNLILKNTIPPKVMFLAFLFCLLRSSVFIIFSNVI